MDWQLDSNLRNKLSSLVGIGYRQAEVLTVMSKEFRHYEWSARTLTRRLNYFGIRRNDPSLTVQDVFACIKAELSGPGKLLGYRSMYKKVRVVHQLRVSIKQVRMAMAMLDPDGVQERRLINKRKRFKRRQFTSMGPNWVWSIDGHDKLMGWHKSEYPLAIHGCVDTFSRKILWLKAWPSNCSPKLPAKLYWDTINETESVPHFIRSDRGNENTTLFSIHNFLRGTSDGSSYLYGSSITNQVIERWWRDLRERHGNFIRSSLDTLNLSGMYNSEDETCKVLLAIILIPLLQQELDSFKLCWNTHRIRRQDIRRPCGIPDFLYQHPETYGCISAGYEVDSARMQYLDKKFLLSAPQWFVAEEVLECVIRILTKSNMFPVTFSNFVAAYITVYRGCRERNIKLAFLPL